MTVAVPGDTLKLTIGSRNPVRLSLFSDKGVPEDLSDVTAFTLVVRDGAADDAQVILTHVETGLTPTDHTLTFTPSANEANALVAGDWWGFLTLTASGVPLSLERPFRVEVSPS